MDTWSCFQTLHPEFMCCRSFSTAVWSWWLLPLNSGKSLPVLTTNHRLPDFSSRRQYQEQVEEMSFLSVPSRTHFIVVQLLSHVQLSATLWTVARQPSLSFNISWNALKLMSIESVIPSNYLILCHLLFLLPSIFPASGFFQRVSSSHQVDKVLEFQLQHQTFQWMFRTDFL